MSALFHLLQDSKVTYDHLGALLQECLRAEKLNDKAEVFRRVLTEAALDEVRSLLSADPNLVRDCDKVLQQRLHERHLKDHPNADSLLQAWAKDGLQFCDTYSLTRFSWLCRELRPATMALNLWERRLKKTCRDWSLPYTAEDEWRERYLSLLRPRWDGIYVGYCGYMQKVRPGSSMTTSRTSNWISYRRYLRLCPPDENGELRALVLQDAAPYEVAVSVLTSLDPRYHIASSAQSSLTDSGNSASQKEKIQPKDAKEKLASKTMLARYTFSEDHVYLDYQCDMGRFQMTLRVGHNSPGYFSEQLAWIDYSMTKEGEETLQFDLGRNQWGDPKDARCDHYPAFFLYRHPTLEHLL